MHEGSRDALRATGVRSQVRGLLRSFDPILIDEELSDRALLIGQRRGTRLHRPQIRTPI